MGKADTNMEQAIREAAQFARDQLVWLARRGTREQRQAARVLAGMIPEISERARQVLSAPASATHRPRPAA